MFLYVTLSLVSLPCSEILTLTPEVFDLRRDCGALGNGVADDSASIHVCLERLATGLKGSERAVLRIPPGVYRIGGDLGPMPTLSRGASISGAGPFASMFTLDKQFSGPLFSWSEAWAAGHYGPNSVDLVRDTSGPTISGIRIVGSRDAKGRQAALNFYDRNDSVLISDVEMDYINGPCISIGRALNAQKAYARESSFYNVKCWYSGSDAEPAVEIGSGQLMTQTALMSLISINSRSSPPRMLAFLSAIQTLTLLRGNSASLACALSKAAATTCKSLLPPTRVWFSG